MNVLGGRVWVLRPRAEGFGINKRERGASGDTPMEVVRRGGFWVTRSGEG
jgi:hypothetical protein